MSKTIQCDIVSAEEQIWSGDAAQVFATGVSGELGIYPRHTPLITQLKPGPVRVVDTQGEEQFFFVGGGIIEVQPHMVTVLADTAVRAKDLDAAAAQRAKEEAERELQNRTGDMEVAEAQAKLAELQRELAVRRVEGSAGGGMVTVVATGALRILEIRIEPSLLAAGDREMLQDLTTAAVNAALANAQQMAQQELQRASAGMALPDLSDLLRSGGGA